MLLGGDCRCDAGGGGGAAEPGKGPPAAGVSPHLKLGCAGAGPALDARSIRWRRLIVVVAIPYCGEGDKGGEETRVVIPNFRSRSPSRAACCASHLMQLLRRGQHSETPLGKPTQPRHHVSRQSTPPLPQRTAIAVPCACNAFTRVTFPPWKHEVATGKFPFEIAPLFEFLPTIVWEVVDHWGKPCSNEMIIESRLHVTGDSAVAAVLTRLGNADAPVADPAPGSARAALVPVPVDNRPGEEKRRPTPQRCVAPNQTEQSATSLDMQVIKPQTHRMVPVAFMPAEYLLGMSIATTKWLR